MSIGLLFFMLGLCHPSQAQNYTYNPNHLDTAKIIQAMKTPHSDLRILSAHRGLHAKLGDSTTVPGTPENSIGSLEAGAIAGLELMEFDVKLTSDGIPICSHDLTWGRETNPQQAGGNVFDPFTSPGTPSNIALNPRVDSMTAAYTQENYNLRDSVSFIPNYGPYNNVPALLQDVISRIDQDQIAAVLALDVKDAASFQAAWLVVKANQDWQGNPFAAHVVWKVNGGIYQTPAAFKAAFGADNGNGVPDYSAINFWPNYNTGQIAAVTASTPTNFGSEQDMIDSLNLFWSDSTLSVIAPEITEKQPGGILDQMRQTSMNAGHAVAEFAAYKDYVYPSDSTQTAQFFWTGGTDPATGAQLGGSCCVDLAHYYFNNPVTDQTRPSDTADERGDFDFVVNQMGFNVITTDDVINWASELARLNFRNLSYMQQTGYGGDPHCNVGYGQYPGCDDPNTPGQTTYTLCAPEGGTCTFTGDRNVAFGANGIYNTVTATNTIACNNTTPGLGPDPTPGVVKACYISPPISYAPGTYCADEDQTCTFGGDAWPIMAANGRYEYSTDSTGYASLYSKQFPCDVTIFERYKGSDPAPGFKKACFFQARQGYAIPHYGPSGYVFCEGQGSGTNVCQFQGPGRVAYGATSGLFGGGTQMFKYGVFNGGVACNDSVFGDPAPGYTKDCYYQVVTASNGSTGTQLGNGPAPGTGSGTGPCDLYASGGTPCVAAHSLVRALFGGYSGKLYQVTRASDNTPMDIGTLAAGGYANAAAQDTFCAGTTCNITIIYDQTTNHNDLPVTAQHGAAVANALLISANGNEAYGLQVTPGVGYRNNATTGVATGSSPEGMYMVTSGTYVNSGCCFDYGNAETNSGDNGNGHMDAINFGTYCEFTCSGSGPWVEADLENGQYMGNGTNLSDVSMPFNFVTAMLKNDGKTTFALKGGNAQSGGLTADYSGTLPTGHTPSYLPMNLEGAVILGTGGDNSDADLGSFFEGAITSGYPTDATENAVQANIVTAGYACGSSGCIGSGGTTVVSEPPGPYTGPNDPGGPGPQDGFASPSIEQPNVFMGSKPALASFQGSLFVAFQANDPGHTLHVTSSPTGYNFPAAAQQPNVMIGSAPAMAAFNDQLYIAFQANDPGHTLHVTSSPTGYNFPAAAQEPNILIGSAPAMAVFNGQLCISFQANDPGHTLHVTCSPDGVNWPTAWQVPNVAIGSAPAMTVFRGMLYVAFLANDPSNDVWIASSTDGVNFSSQVLAGQTMDGNSSPALVVSNNVLYYIYEANDTDHEMLVTASADGSNWQGPAAYLGIQMGAQGPGAAAFGNGVSVGFQSNDSRNVLFITNKVTEASSYTGPSDPNGSGPQDDFSQTASLQSNIFMGSKPALASFNGGVFVAFRANDSGHTLHITSSPDGITFPAATQQPNVQMGSAPAIAEFKGILYVAFQANDAGHTLHVTSSPSGYNFPAAAQEPNIQIGGAPAMAVFNNKLYLAFQANDPGHTLHVTASADGVTWPSAWQIPNIAIGSDPAMAVVNGKLYIAFRADDPSNDVWIASSSDGVNFTSQVLAGQTMGGSSSPALAVSLGELFYIYGANDLGNEMLVTESNDGSTWQGPAAYTGTQMGATGPGATAFGAGVSVGFQSNDSRNALFITKGTLFSTTINVRPCDLLASASPATPCVAAYSTIRRLYSAYTGPLYRITRASDSTSSDIGLLGDGYASAQTQDSFCVKTFCSITKIYDQTSNHNDLTAAPPGQNGSGPAANGFDNVAPATAAPMFAGGHKVYGLYSQPGYGYRNDATKGIPSKGAPEGVYMLTSAKGLVPAADINGACCFDFGNAETTNNDDLAGRMDAMRVACIGSPCVPVSGLDMENGTYGNVPGVAGTAVMIAMGWNDGQHNFSTYIGDPLIGNLVSTGTLPLPGGYAPMRQEGAIILGIGGDNSNGASGYFYEGAMTQGAPSSASLSSVRASAGLPGFQFPTGSPAGLVEDGGTYTIENQASQMYLDNYCDGCSGVAPTNGVQVIQYPGNGWLTQTWTLHGQGNGYYTMVNAQSGMCLDDPWGNGTPSRTLPQSPGTSTMLWQQPCNGNAAQNWEFIPQSNGNFVIQNQAATTNHGSSMVLDVYNGLAIQGMQMWVSTANGLPPQNWHLAHQ